MRVILVVLVSLLAVCVQAANLPHEKSFKVEDIRVQGLQRVSAGSVFSAFPVNIGDEVDSVGLARAIRSLFQTGLFTDIQVSKDNGVMFITVVERPAIKEIKIEGNDAISSDDLKKGLDSVGLTEGQVFKRSTLEKMELEILRSYVGQGRYNAAVDAKVEDLPRNQVSIVLDIDEGDVASIVHINFVGNSVFTDKELQKLMELQTSSFLSFIFNDDKYAREKLSGDLERVRSFYLDRGYLKFSIESTQVSISPEMDSVFITVNVSEGTKYSVKDIELKGNLIVEEELRKLILLKEGETFSRVKLTTSSEIMSKRLGREGYTFANVSGIPEVHDDNTASIVFMVDPGRRAYVRRVNFQGNVTTSDDVLRQEMVQMEGAVASTDLIEGSKTKLERLGFFKEVRVETPAVPGQSDQIDVNYTVEEQPSGSLSASVGYSQGSGFVLGGSVSENNFLGTGRRVSFGLNASQSVKSANFSYLNPYYTVDGVSRGFSLTARQTDYTEEDISSFTLDTIGGAVTFGYPVDNFTRLSFGLGANKSKITMGSRPAQEISQFIDDHGNDYNLFSFSGSWSRSTLNKGLFATQGLSQSLSLEVMVPQVSDLEFFKLSYRNKFYYPVDSEHDWVLYLRSELAYGDGYGSESALPFFEHYYSGGFGSVRGWEQSSLGPRSTPHPDDIGDPDPFGGNILTEGSAELIFPIPFVEDTRSMRASLYFDAGNVFDTSRGYDPAFDEVRMSVGVSFSWVTAIGPLAFSLAKPLNAKEGDDTQTFQFSLGQPF